MVLQNREEVESLIVSGVSREGLNMPKFVAGAAMLLPRNLKSVAQLSGVTALEPGRIAEQTGERVELIIFDIDETLTEHHEEFPGDHIDKLRDLARAGIKIALYSNSKATPRLLVPYDLLDGELYIHETQYQKPRKEGFHEICDVMGVNIANTLMVGDNPFTDGGSNMAGIEYVHVDPYRFEHAEIQSLSRVHQTQVREKATALMRFYDKIYGRKPLTDSDMHFAA